MQKAGTSYGSYRFGMSFKRGNKQKGGALADQKIEAGGSEATHRVNVSERVK